MSFILDKKFSLPKITELCIDHDYLKFNAALISLFKKLKYN